MRAISESSTPCQNAHLILNRLACAEAQANFEASSFSIRCVVRCGFRIRLTLIMSSSGEYCCVQHFAASSTIWPFSNCETHADSSKIVTCFTLHLDPSLLDARAPFNGSLVILQFALDQPKPRPRPLAALVPLPILLPLADGMVPLPLPTDVPAAV